MASFSHTSVLYHETVDGLNLKENGVYVDCTLGGGGHSALLLSRLKQCRLIALDQDAQAIANARERFAGESRIELVRSNFEQVGSVLDALAPDGIDGVMIDLGVSSHQLDTPERGFSYHYDAVLDMRMDQDAALTAKAVVNGYSQSELCRILKEYGEVDEIEICGLCTDICVISNAIILKSAFPDAKVIVDGKCSAGVTMESHNNALNAMRAVQIEIKA